MLNNCLAVRNVAMAVSFILTAIPVLVFLGPTTFVLAGNGEETAIPTLHLLALMPLAETAGLPNQSSYQVLHTAAQLAVDKINMRDDILVGYNLELVRANAETCNQRLVTEAMGNFVRSVTDRDLNIVGVVGLLCSTVTQAVSQLAIPERPEIDLLQISAGATSPVFANETEYPRLYRMIPSSAVYNDAVLALMTEFQWRRISVVQDTTLVQHTTTADDFVRKVKGRSELNLVFLGDVTPTFPTSPIQSLVQKAARVIYASVTASEARELLCESYWGGHRWPEFVWLFHDLSFEELLESTENCSNDTMVLEGVFFLQYRLQPNSSTTLVSGQTYSEYRMNLQEHLPGAWENHNANALHDSIWAFALALNNSRLEELESQGSKSNVTTDVERNLRTVNFSGALGDIIFNDKREVVTIVDIFHVINGSLMYAGHYNPLSENITVHLPPERIPRDDFDVMKGLISIAFPIVTFVTAAILILFTTIILGFFIYYRNKPSIKASSPLLSLLVLAGCYMLYIVCLLSGAAELIPEHFGSLCFAQVWFAAISVQLMYSALFMRLLRIYRIFFYIFEKPGKIWSNQAMFALTFIPVFVTAILLTLWSAVDPIVTGKTPPAFNSTSDPPHYRVDIFCSVQSGQLIVWLSVILYGVNGVTILAVAVLATLTRKIHLDCFKDTKQVNAFVFSTAMCLCIWFPYVIVFGQAQLIIIPEAAYVFSVLPYILIPLLCKMLLFVPKILAARHEKTILSRKRVTKYSIPYAVSAMHTRMNRIDSFASTNSVTCMCRLDSIASSSSLSPLQTHCAVSTGHTCTNRLETTVSNNSLPPLQIASSSRYNTPVTNGHINPEAP